MSPNFLEIVATVFYRLTFAECTPSQKLKIRVCTYLWLYKNVCGEEHLTEVKRKKELEKEDGNFISTQIFYSRWLLSSLVADWLQKIMRLMSKFIGK